jgi:hypothetical protein
MMVVK